MGSQTIAKTVNRQMYVDFPNMSDKTRRALPHQTRFAGSFFAKQRRLMAIFCISITMTLLVAGCPPPYTPCEPGEEVECACGYDLFATQTCLDDGTYEACRCDEAIPRVDADAGTLDPREDGGLPIVEDSGTAPEPEDAGSPPVPEDAGPTGPGTPDAGTLDGGGGDPGSPDAGPAYLAVGSLCSQDGDPREPGAECHNIFPGDENASACFWLCETEGESCATARTENGGFCTPYNGTLLCTELSENHALCGNTLNRGCIDQTQRCQTIIGQEQQRCVTPCSVESPETCASPIDGGACGCSEPTTECSDRFFLDAESTEGICFIPTTNGDMCLEVEPAEALTICSNSQVCDDTSQICGPGIHSVVLTDNSSSDTVTDGLGDKNQWIHTTSAQWTTSSVQASLKGMLGADAAFTLGDEEISVTASYTLDIDIRSEGDWRLDMEHHILGAFSIIDEKVLLEDAGGTATISAITAQAAFEGGSPVTFDFNVDVPSVTHALYGGEGTTDQEFQGMGSGQLFGSGSGTAQVTFTFTLFAKSDSNLTFPAAAGDEVAIRLGVSDTIMQNFTAGEYPSGNGDLGERDIQADGHFMTATLVPLPE